MLFLSFGGNGGRLDGDEKFSPWILELVGSETKTIV